MPGFDKTGPLGNGAYTGRRLGNCQEQGVNLQNSIDSNMGRGLGWRNNPRVYNPQNPNINGTYGNQFRGAGYGRGYGCGCRIGRGF